MKTFFVYKVFRFTFAARKSDNYYGCNKISFD